MLMTEEQLLCARAHIILCKFHVNVIFFVMKSSALLLCLASDECPFVEHHSSIHAQVLLIIGNFSQQGFLAAHLKIVLSSCGCDDLAMYVDNNGI